MTYTIPNHYGSSFAQEQTRWNLPEGTITKIAAWAVPAGVHAQLSLPSHLDLYFASTGWWTVNLDDAVASFIEGGEVEPEENYTDCGEIEMNSDCRSEMLNEWLCDELDVVVSELNPDDVPVSRYAPTYEIRRNDAHLEYIQELDGVFGIDSPLFVGCVYTSPEAAAIALMQYLAPTEVLMSLSAVESRIAASKLMPDYN